MTEISQSCSIPKIRRDRCSSIRAGKPSSSLLFPATPLPSHMLRMFDVRGRHMGAFPCKHGRHPVARRLTKYRNLCESIALHILGNREDAEECASDALMKVYGSIPPEKPAFLKAFTLKAARHTAIDCLRKRNAGRRPDAHLTDVERGCGRT